MLERDNKVRAAFDLGAEHDAGTAGRLLERNRPGKFLFERLGRCLLCAPAGLLFRALAIPTGLLCGAFPRFPRLGGNAFRLKL